MVKLEATYHKKKLYVPNEIVERLQLKDGDKVDYVILGQDEVELKINRTKSAKDLLMKELNSPKPIGVKSPLKRREIYEDVN